MTKKEKVKIKINYVKGERDLDTVLNELVRDAVNKGISNYKYGRKSS